MPYWCHRKCYKCAFDTWYGKFAACVWELKVKYAEASYEKYENEKSGEEATEQSDEKKECSCSFTSALSSFTFLNL